MAETLVHSLLGHGNVSMALRCYASLVATSEEPLGLILHEDGTLTDADRATLEERLPVRRWILREEADAQTAEHLVAHPFCQRYRREHPLALKLIDIVLLGGPELFFCDSDILFLYPHSGLFAPALDGADAVFMTDIREPYSLRPWQVSPFRSQRLLSRLNTGLIALRRAAYDLDFIESFLARNWSSAGFRLRPGWIEQTAWSALGSRLTCRTYDPTQLSVAQPALKVMPGQTVGIHFVSSYRGMINEITEASGSGAPQKIRTFPARRASSAGLLANEIRVRWARRRSG